MQKLLIIGIGIVVLLVVGMAVFSSYTKEETDNSIPRINNIEREKNNSQINNCKNKKEDATQTQKPPATDLDGVADNLEQDSLNHQEYLGEVAENGAQLNNPHPENAPTNESSSTPNQSPNNCE